MDRKAVSFLALLVFALQISGVMASPPSEIPEEAMPPARTPVKHIAPTLPPRPVPPGPPMTLERLNRLPVSGVVYQEMLRELPENAQQVDLESMDLFMTEEPLTSQEETLDLATLTATARTTVNSTSDTLQDVEPSVMSVNISGVTYTSSVEIKYVSVPGLTGMRPRNHFNTTSDFVSFQRGQLAVPAGYALSGDPLMSVNPYTGGIAPKRMYCVGLLFNTGGVNAPSAIGLWRSDDGGRTWSNPTIVASQAGGGYMVDKPAVTVSWHSNSLGYVYVSWTSIDNNTPNSTSNSIWVARSTDGGLTFPNRTVITYDDVQGSQVVVNAHTGEVHCIWTNNLNNDIRTAKSTNFGITFGPHEVVGGGNLLTWRTGTTLNGGVRAPSLPMARYNSVSRRIVVVWHANGDAGTDVYYAYKPCPANCNFWGWALQRRINDVATNDQFMPAIDFNTTGNLIIPFYDRRDDAGNLLYHQYFAYTDSSGNAVHGNQRISSFASDPRNHTAATGFAGFIGDYQDVWDWTTFSDGESATNSWIGIQNAVSIGDVYLSRIFP